MGGGGWWIMNKDKHVNNLSYEGKTKWQIHVTNIRTKMKNQECLLELVFPFCFSKVQRAKSTALPGSPASWCQCGQRMVCSPPCAKAECQTTATTQATKPVNNTSVTIWKPRGLGTPSECWVSASNINLININVWLGSFWRLLTTVRLLWFYERQLWNGSWRWGRMNALLQEASRITFWPIMCRYTLLSLSLGLWSSLKLYNQMKDQWKTWKLKCC